MADRYQDRPLPADDDYDRGDDPHAPARAESDPLAELARLIGQTDPFAMGRANQTVAPQSAARDRYQPPEPIDDTPAAGPPPWMQRAAVRQEVPQQDYPSTQHPLRRYATPVAPEPNYDPEPSYADADQSDPARYDEALYGQLATGEEEQRRGAAYADDAYAYQDGYDEGAEEPVRKRGGMMTVAVVAALAVLGIGTAFAYRTYLGSARSGDVPIIKADPTPTKIVPAPGDGSKVPDRMTAGDGTEKIVPREEAPVDINAKPAPRVVFPPLNQSGNPQPPVANAAPVGPAPAAAPPAVIPNGVQPGAEPRKIKTIPVAGDPLNGGVPPAVAAPLAPAKPGRVAAPRTPAAAAPAANAPLSLSPQATEPAPAAEPPKTRMAAVTPAPAPAAAAPSGGGYLVQISSQRNEADAQASFRALQGKFPAVLGSRSPVIKRADLGDKGTYYRAMVGPFGSTEEAAQFCGSLKAAGGQCVVQRN